MYHHLSYFNIYISWVLGQDAYDPEFSVLHKWGLFSPHCCIIIVTVSINASPLETVYSHNSSDLRAADSARQVWDV